MELTLCLVLVLVAGVDAPYGLLLLDRQLLNDVVAGGAALWSWRLLLPPPLLRRAARTCRQAADWRPEQSAACSARRSRHLPWRLCGSPRRGKGHRRIRRRAHGRPLATPTTSLPVLPRDHLDITLIKYLLLAGCQGGQWWGCRRAQAPHPLSALFLLT